MQSELFFFSEFIQDTFLEALLYRKKLSTLHNIINIFLSSSVIQRLEFVGGFIGVQYSQRSTYSQMSSNILKLISTHFPQLVIEECSAAILLRKEMADMFFVFVRNTYDCFSNYFFQTKMETSTKLPNLSIFWDLEYHCHSPSRLHSFKFRVNQLSLTLLLTCIVHGALRLVIRI